MKEKLSDFYYRISMKKKWALFICAIILYEIVLIGYFGYKNYEDVIEEHFISSVQDKVSSVTGQVAENLKALEEFAMQLQYDQYIYSFIEDKEYSSIPDYEFKRNAEKHLGSIVLSRPEVTLASIQFTKEPDRIYTVTNNKSYADELDFADAKIYEKKLEKEKNTLYYIDDQKDLYIVQKIISRRTFEHSATIVMKIDTNLVFRKLAGILEGAKKGVYVFGLDHKEILIAGEVSQSHKEKVQGYLKEKSLPDLYPGANPKNEMIVYDKIQTRHQEIGVAVLIFKNILFQEIRALSRKVIIVALLTVPIFLLLAYKLYKDLIQPIYDLSAKMEQIENGEMGVLVESGRKDEIGVLFRSFNKMSKKINYLVNRVYKEQLALKNSEIRALQAQINPHFLYNTLETINWTARLSGADDVAEMIEALAGIMEINIDRKAERFLTLEEEIKYTNHYIFLIKKRFGDKIEFKQEIDEAVMKHKVPRLILQPMIENAIEHGIEPVGKGIVVLRVEIQDQRLVIEIEDSGQGIKQEMISDLKYNLDHWDQGPLEKPDLSSHGKTGVINVHARLKLIYGEKSGVEINSVYGKGTLISIRVPIEEEEDV